jgi:hypothetical protein
MDGSYQCDNRDVCADVLLLAQDKVAQEFSVEIVDVFRGLVEQLWERLVMFIGDMATAAVFQSARREAMQDHPFLEGVSVDREGVRLDQLRENPGALDRAAVQAGFLAFLDGVVALLTDLTGDILMRKLGPLVEAFRAELGGSGDGESGRWRLGEWKREGGRG